MRWLAVLLAAPALAASLADLKDTAAKLRDQRDEMEGWRGESPLLTGFKHQLHDWLRSQMTGEIADTAAFADGINDQLKKAGLLCPEEACDAGNFLGYMLPVEFSPVDNSPGWLLIETAVGISCGADDSLYLYEWSGGGWKYRFDSEQNGYGRAKYHPQDVNHLELTKPDAAGNRLLLILGTNPACDSAWQALYYRLYRIGASPPVTLLDGTHGIFSSPNDLQSRIDPDGSVTIELSDRSIDPNAVLRPYVLHFRIEKNGLKRVEPIVLRPADFVDEWLTHDWSEIADHSESKLQAIQRTLHNENGVAGEFLFVEPCTRREHQTQIGVDLAHRGAFYFLVQDLGDYRYRMLDVSRHRQSGCPGDAKPDFASRPSLFPPVRAGN